jgi:hypothetical protein
MCPYDTPLDRQAAFAVCIRSANGNKPIARTDRELERLLGLIDIYRDSKDSKIFAKNARIGRNFERAQRVQDCHDLQNHLSSVTALIRSPIRNLPG